jgi:hypothetical protein
MDHPRWLGESIASSRAEPTQFMRTGWRMANPALEGEKLDEKLKVIGCTTGSKTTGLSSSPSSFCPLALATVQSHIDKLRSSINAMGEV